MFNSYVKNLKISQKILITVLLIALAAQISAVIPAVIGILNIARDSQAEAISSGKFTSQKSHDALKNQAESYLLELSNSMSDASDNIFEEVSDQTISLSEAANDVYRNPEKFNGHILPLPETTDSADRSARENASEKAFAIDPASISEGDEYALAYNTSQHSKSEKIYKTSVENWKNLSENERNSISQNNIVVSNNPVPEKIKQEIKILSNFSHTAKSIYNSNAAVSSVYAGTESGICYHYSTGNSSKRYDPRKRPWYTDAVNAAKNKQPVWQSKYLSKSNGVPCITCSKAFTDKNGKVIGVIAIDMYIDDVNKYIIGSTIGNTGYAFVVDNNGKIIMHPQNDINSAEYESPLDSDSASESYKDLISKMASGKSGVTTAQINESEYYAAFSPMVTTGWSLGAVSKADEILAPSYEIQNVINSSVENTENSIKSNLFKIFIRFFVILVILSIIIYIAGIKLSKEISSPIKKLSRQAKIIGEGKFSSRIKVNSNDEIGVLSNSFNKMAENLNLYMENLKKTTAEKEKIHSELMIAKKIQKSMLPCIFPAFPERSDFDIYALMDPAREVGGDFYDFFFVDKKHLAVVIADVSGKGVSAALFMVIAKILIKNQLQIGDSPEKALEQVNNRLCENNEAGMFVTAFTGIIDIETGEFVFSNAGHNPPLVYHSESNQYQFIKSPKGFVLGGMPNMKYTKEKMFFKREDSLFLYTDGVTEAMNPQGELFSKERLESILNNASTKKLKIKDIITHLRKEIDKFADGAERSDDITMLAFKDFDIPNKYNSKGCNRENS